MTKHRRSSAAALPASHAVRRADAAFAAQWAQFTRLKFTEDSLANDRRMMRRWQLMPYLAFVIPVDDPEVRAQLASWQNAFADTLPYAPQPIDRAHVTLHYVGRLRTSAWLLLLPNTFPRASLEGMAARARRALAQCSPFTLGIGPPNAFPNVLFAEVHDTDNECLRATRLRVRRALPLRARPSSPWNYLPHITLAYWGKQPVPPLVERLRPLREIEPLPLRVTRIRFTIYWRDLLPTAPDVLARAREEVIAEYTLAPRN